MNYRVWTRILGIVVLGTSWMVSPNLHAATETSDGYSIEDFRLHSTGDLVDVCTIDTGHADYAIATAFCYGFFEGGTHYHDTISKADWYEDIVCIPPDVTRTQAVATFVQYINANPQYEQEPPIDAIFRALVAKWPCAD